MQVIPKEKHQILKQAFETICDESLNNLSSNHVKSKHSYKTKRRKRNHNSSNGTACECVLTKGQGAEFLETAEHVMKQVLNFNHKIPISDVEVKVNDAPHKISVKDQKREKNDLFDANLVHDKQLETNQNHSFTYFI